MESALLFYILFDNASQSHLRMPVDFLLHSATRDELRIARRIRLSWCLTQENETSFNDE